MYAVVVSPSVRCGCSVVAASRRPSVSTKNSRVIASYLSKVAHFNLTHLLFGALVGATPFEFRGDLWRQKTRVPWLSCRVACVHDPKFSRFDTIPACEGRTDRRTDG